MAGPYYVRSTAATPTSPFNTGWANAAATLAAALGVAAAGETIYVAEDHSETQASPMPLTSPGTSASPVKILCTNHTSAPPLAADTATTAIVATSAANSITMTGSAYSAGVTYSAGSGASNASVNTGTWAFENAGLKLNTTSASARLTQSVAGLCEWTNTVLTFGSAAQSVHLDFSSVIRWRGASSSVAGTAPTALFVSTNTQKLAVLTLANVDLTLLAGSSTIFGGAPASPIIAHVTGCHLTAGVTLAVAQQPGSTIDLIGSDSGAVTSSTQRVQYQGSLASSTATYLRAADDLNSFSWHVDTTGTGAPSFASPFECPPILVAVAAGARTVTLELASTNALTNADAWLTVEYMGTASAAWTSIATSRAANVLTAGAALPSSAAAWINAAGLNTYAPTVGFTTTEPGYIRITVKVATAQTLYVDPAPALT